MALALSSAVGYWSLLSAALVRVRRYRFIEARGVMWWISAGCGGLVAASLVRAIESTQRAGSQGWTSALHVGAALTWAIGSVLVVVVLSKGFFFLVTSIHGVKNVPWTPTFSLGVEDSEESVSVNLSRCAS
jgi:hypothetical protein